MPLRTRERKFKKLMSKFQVYYMKHKLLHGQDHEDTLTTATDLVYFYNHLENYDKAEKVLKRVIDLGKSALGENSIVVVKAKSTLSEIYFWQNKYFLAAEVSEVVFNITRKELKSISYINSVKSICNYWEMAEDFERRKQFLDRLLILELKDFGEKHENTLNTKFRIAQTMSLLGEDQKALKMMYKILPLAAKVGDYRKYLHADISNDIAWLKSEMEPSDNLLGLDTNIFRKLRRAEHYRKIWENNKALKLFNQTYPHLELVLGKEHEETLRTWCEIGGLLDRLYNFGESERSLRSMLVLQKKILGESHALTLDTTYYLAAKFRGNRKYSAAVELCEEVLEGKDLIESHDNFVSVEHILKLCLRKIDKNKLKEYLTQTLQKVQTKLGSKHEKTLDVKFELAESCWELGEREQALEMMEQLLQLREKVLGKDDWKTLKTKERISEMNESLSKSNINFSNESNECSDSESNSDGEYDSGREYDSDSDFDEDITFDFEREFGSDNVE